MGGAATALILLSRTPGQASARGRGAARGELDMTASEPMPIELDQAGDREPASKLERE